MLTIEKKIIAFVEKNLFFLSALMLAAIAFVVRRWGIWYHSEDYIYYFDMHEGNIQSSFYWLLVRLMGYSFDIPMHGIKWLAAMADFAVAVLVVMLCKGKKTWKDCTAPETGKLLLLYAGCLFAPVMFLRGCIWAQVDSVAAAFLLGAMYLWQKAMQGKQQFLLMAAAVLLAGLGIALYPIFMLAVIAFFFLEKRCYQRRNVVALLSIFLLAILWSGICGAITSLGFGSGVRSLVQWMTYHPYTGELYTGGAEWLGWLLLLGGYGITLYSGVAAFQKKIPIVIAIGIQLIVSICYGGMLGW